MIPDRNLEQWKSAVDRPLRGGAGARQSLQAAKVLLSARGQRAILSSGRARQNRLAQVAVIASDAEGCSHRREQRRDDDDEHSAGNHLAAPGGTQTPKRIGRLIRRAVVPGGRLAVSTLRSDEEIPLFRELRRVAERHLGAVADQRLSLGDAAQLERLLRDAGFREVHSRTISRTIRFDDGAPFLRLNAMALVEMSAAGREMGHEERERVLAAIVCDSVPVVQSYADGSGMAFELSTNLTTAKGDGTFYSTILLRITIRISRSAAVS
jgi:hypothetical protein